ncbi:aspartic endopeptidase Pep1/aspergillopepsin F [Talaromyces stipitatus ATCC 10500]|uniref:Penicillopepsin-1 n=1 Tax=Talaromyces stipitatus (strain ATCC 10500 / CBS 375.48 / QM 6759 / NRRL 1006) TaxID=441959 RepID=PEPA_TALSN|nr:aspartic endopeptidase Pep1/aspergillopepsin F [Talaromyces stipitatus ATCC 10500]B8MF81.1 RecName: Full=Penicillopepsin-1; AltName: Full=Aspartic protease pepA; Flags: Precursor [Talaromyces stipitatus ATCC 10500]EED16180.1 aspartic endopeptidase Pep1/aspergillopepsin F [Talaromyces stipitatus ATCC 10500]
MVNSKTVVSALALSALAAAAPAPSSTTSFSINQVAVKKPAIHPAVKYAKALAKYHAEIPSNVASAAASAQSGSATNKPTADDEEYVTPITAGSSTLHLDFDTGSADLWTYSASTRGVGSHSTYDTSTGKKVSGASWQISYGDGSSASGVVYKDKVVVGGVTASSQAVEVATQVSSEFSQDTSNDGLLGLAFSSINTVSPTPQKTFYDNVKSSLAKPVFAVTLKHQAPGTYDFGFIDKSKYKGSLAYTNVDNSQGFWQFTADGYSIGGSGGGSSFSAIADTGTTLVLLDDSIVDEYYSQVQGAQNDSSQGGYVFDCSADLPDFGVQIGDYTAVIPGKYINYASTGSTCFGGIQSNSGIGFSILGDVFLKSQYVVFDGDNLQLGFAAQA